MLNNSQAQDYDRAQVLENFFGENKVLYVAYPPFAREVDDFLENWKLFKSYVPEKDSDGTLITKGKDDLKKSFADDAATICTTVKSYAKKYNLPLLAASVNFSSSKIVRLKDSAIVGFGDKLVKIITPLLTDANFMTYGIDQQALDSLTDGAAAFASEIGMAKVANTNSGVTNSDIDDVIKLINGNIGQFRMLIKWFKKKNPQFVKAMLVNAAKENTGVRHSGIEGVITDAATGAVIENAEISIVGKDKTTVTDLYGKYKLISVRPGAYKITFSAKGYASKTLVVRINRGKIDILDMTL